MDSFISLPRLIQNHAQSGRNSAELPFNNSYKACTGFCKNLEKLMLCVFSYFYIDHWKPPLGCFFLYFLPGIYKNTIFSASLVDKFKQ